MSNQKILLARPNSFIVKHMKQLVMDVSCEPTPLQHTDELSKFQSSDIRGIVISTAVSSTVKEDYPEVLHAVVDRYPTKPIFLATLIDTELVKRMASRKLAEHKITRNLLSIDEARAKERLSPTEDIIIIRKQDIADKSLYPDTIDVVKRALV